jgi:tetratricopeptide (TPR) repeat protein
MAANEFRAAIQGDPHPKWIDAWAHINIGEIFDLTGQRDRAVNEYTKALDTEDDTEDAQAVAKEFLSHRAKDEDLRGYHILGPYIKYAKAAKATATVPAQYLREARVAELEGTFSKVNCLSARARMLIGKA